MQFAAYGQFVLVDYMINSIDCLQQEKIIYTRFRIQTSTKIWSDPDSDLVFFKKKSPQAVQIPGSKSPDPEPKPEIPLGYPRIHFFL